ncbi:MAG: hypothetical protein DIKNOCCD_01832 [bacterium]|nr:hypothetical protein [bacterium]
MSRVENMEEFFVMILVNLLVVCTQADEINQKGLSGGEELTGAMGVTDAMGVTGAINVAPTVA